MNDNTKNITKRIKSGLVCGTISGIAAELQVFFSLNGVGNIPLGIVTNGLFPAVFVTGGFVAGYKAFEDSKTKAGTPFEEEGKCLKKTGMSNQEQIEYLQEQKNILLGNTEAYNDKPKSF